VLFQNITCYTNSLLSHIHVNTANLLNTTCTLVATNVILGRLECSLSSRLELLELRRQDAHVLEAVKGIDVALALS
jgi:hypothetical protein